MALGSVGLTTQIYNNHLKSALLLLGFPFLLLLMLGSFFSCLDLLSQMSVQPDYSRLNYIQSFHAGISGVVVYGHWALLTAGVWFVIAYFFHGNMMRMAAGSSPITRQQYPKLYNMLENLCISRGLPMPTFELIDSPALNAFASGIDQKSYRIVLTRGLVESLPDDELEAVIGHELTHIMNRDVRLLIISVIFVGIISFLAQITYRMLIRGLRPNYPVKRDEKRNNGMIVMLVALVILVIGYILATVIRFALSRKREYLADAGSVELTKNPEAMMRALLRISGHDTVQGMPDGVQQMCIENSHNFMGVFATHPSIEARVKTISQMTGASIPALADDGPAGAGPWN